ncbi:MAG: Gfo/Idh/MocA family oxidoreductase [Rhodothermales bacterium]
MTRRKFMEGVAAASAMTIVPRSVLGGPGYVAPSDKINIAQIGCGTQAINQFNTGILTRDDIQLTSVTDPNRDSQDYVSWGPFSTQRSARRLLQDDSWGEGDTGTRGGREYAKLISETYYGKTAGRESYDGIRAYADFREMLAQEDEADAVMVIVPDHQHAGIAIAAMEAGKHVIMHKPVAVTPYEVRRVMETIDRTGKITHLLAYHPKEQFRRLESWLSGGMIGRIREVHNWTNRPVWPQGWSDYPQERVSVPDGMNWDLWQGPVPEQNYHPLLTHTLYRGWYNYGVGCLGDMGNYSLWQPHRFLDLDAPNMVEAYTNKSVILTEQNTCRNTNASPVAFPNASQIHFRFPAKGDRPEVDMYWYSGAMKPQTPKEMIDDGTQLPSEGMLFVGDHGKMLCDFYGGNPQLLPQSRMKALGVGEEEDVDSDQNDDWTHAILTDGHTPGSFKDAESLAYTTALGVIALRTPTERLHWDHANLGFTNSSEANNLVRRERREGWEI